jgi:hypothetical protein
MYILKKENHEREIIHRKHQKKNLRAAAVTRTKGIWIAGPLYLPLHQSQYKFVNTLGTHSIHQHIHLATCIYMVKMYLIQADIFDVSSYSIIKYS